MPDVPDTQSQPAGQRPDAEPARAAPARRPPPSPLAVITAALGLFFVVLTLMAIQVRNGRDPALGPGPVTPSTGKVLKSTSASQGQQATKIVTRTSPTPP